MSKGAAAMTGLSANPQFVTLGAMGEVFAAPVEHVQEILEMCPMARLPNSPQSFLGMIDLRGEGIPVVDLRLALGFPPTADTLNTRIVVLRFASGDRRHCLALRADQVFEVTTLDSSELEQPPRIGAPWQTEAVRGVGRRKGSFVLVLALDSLFGSH